MVAICAKKERNVKPNLSAMYSYLLECESRKEYGYLERREKPNPAQPGPSTRGTPPKCLTNPPMFANPKSRNGMDRFIHQADSYTRTKTVSDHLR